MTWQQKQLMKCSCLKLPACWNESSASTTLLNVHVSHEWCMVCWCILYTFLAVCYWHKAAKSGKILCVFAALACYLHLTARLKSWVNWACQYTVNQHICHSCFNKNRIKQIFNLNFFLNVLHFLTVIIMIISSAVLPFGHKVTHYYHI